MAETIDDIAREIVETWIEPADIPPIDPFDAEALIGSITAALLAVAREQREQALDEAIDVVMEIRTDAPNWKEQAVESLTAIRNSGETSNEG